MYIYRLLIMFAHSMGWALVWAIGGPGPWPRPLISTIVGLLDFRGCFDFIEYLRVVGVGRLPPLAACAAIAYTLS